MVTAEIFSLIISSEFCNRYARHTLTYVEKFPHKIQFLFLRNRLVATSTKKSSEVAQLNMSEKAQVHQFFFKEVSIIPNVLSLSACRR
jgi:hypothetical protein